jgi:uncharacterized membrane protein YkvA (DUF1232 family)
MSDTQQGYAKDYSDDGFWAKVIQFAKVAGKEVIEKALWLHYVLKKPDVPVWAKTVIIGALGYFISPIDAIPDMTPVVGYADDLGVLAMAVAAVAIYIDDEVKFQTAQKMKDWFGE